MDVKVTEKGFGCAEEMAGLLRTISCETIVCLKSLHFDSAVGCHHTCRSDSLVCAVYFPRFHGLLLWRLTYWVKNNFYYRL